MMSACDGRLAHNIRKQEITEKMRAVFRPLLIFRPAKQRPQKIQDIFRGFFVRDLPFGLPQMGV